MATDQQTLQLLATHLDNTLSIDAAVRNKATDEIRALESRPGSSLLLLSLMTHPSFSPATRQAASITFKNFILQHWDDDPTPQSLLPPHDRTTIKQHLVSLMLSAPPSIQQQLSQALALISKSDFPDNWQSLLPDLISQMMNPASTHLVIIGCLSTMHSIFFRYRHEYRSDALWTEINYVIGLLGQPLTTLFTSLTGAILSSPPTPTPSSLILQQSEQLALVLDIYLSLSSQDIPAFFEDHMNDWFAPFQSLIKLPTSSTAMEDDANIMDKCKSTICEIITIYALRYEDQFAPYTGSFVQLVWSLLSSLSASSQYDSLVSTSIKFLTSVISKPWNKSLFASPDALQSIIAQIIVPQIKLRESDIDTFTEDPVEWVRRDIEGSDVDTRRRVTIDFIRGLLVNFDRELTELMKGYVGELISSYNAAPQSKWQEKDAAIYIILALSSKSATKSRGITQTNPYIDLSSFFSTQIIGELQGNSASPILTADAIRFIAAFRSQLSLAQMVSLFPLLIQSLQSPHYVVHTYAAYAIERILSLRGDTGYVVSQADFQPFVQSALVALFGVMERVQESRENEYIMRCILRVVTLAEEMIVPLLPTLIDALTKILIQITANPTHPNFNHFLFDTFAALIVNLCKGGQGGQARVEEFENALFRVFQAVLTSESRSEFSQYIFQILSLLLERRTGLSQPYLAIYSSLMDLSLYENPGNVPALTRFLSAYLYRFKQSSTTLTPGRLQQLLAVYQKLLANRRQHLLALDLLIGIVDTVAWGVVEGYVSGILTQLFIKFQNMPGNVFFAKAIVFFSVFILRYGAAQWVKSLEAIQPDITRMLMCTIVLINLPFIISQNDKKTATVGLVELLTSGTLSAANAGAVVPELIAALVDVNAKSSVIITEVDGEDEEELTTVGDQSAFSKLAHATGQAVAYTQVNDGKAALVAGVREVAAKAGGVDRLMQGFADWNVRKKVQDFLAEHGLAS